MVNLKNIVESTLPHYLRLHQDLSKDFCCQLHRISFKSGMASKPTHDVYFHNRICAGIDCNVEEKNKQACSQDLLREDDKEENAYGGLHAARG